MLPRCPTRQGLSAHTGFAAVPHNVVCFNEQPQHKCQWTRLLNAVTWSADLMQLEGPSEPESTEMRMFPNVRTE